MNVSLPPDLDTYVRSLVQGGEFSSASKVIRESLRLLRQQEEAETARLCALIQEGLGSGEPVSMSRDDVRELIGQRFAELRAEVERGERPPPGGPGSISF